MSKQDTDDLLMQVADDFRKHHIGTESEENDKKYARVSGEIVLRCASDNAQRVVRTTVDLNEAANSEEHRNTEGLEKSNSLSGEQSRARSCAY